MKFPDTNCKPYTEMALRENLVEYLEKIYIKMILKPSRKTL